MAFVKILQFNIKLQKKLTTRLEQLEDYYAIERSSFILREILKVSKELLKLRTEEQQLSSLINNFSKVKKI